MFHIEAIVFWVLWDMVSHSTHISKEEFRAWQDQALGEDQVKSLNLLLDFHRAGCWCWEYQAMGSNGKHKYIKGYRHDRVNGIGFTIWRSNALGREQFAEGWFSDLNDNYCVMCRLTSLPPAFACSSGVSGGDSARGTCLLLCRVPRVPGCWSWLWQRMQSANRKRSHGADKLPRVLVSPLNEIHPVWVLLTLLLYNLREQCGGEMMEATFCL